MDTDTNDITTNGFNNCLTRDGQGSATANLPMNGFKLTGLGAATAVGDALSFGHPVAGVTTGYNGPAAFAGTDTGINANSVFQADGVLFVAYCSLQNGAGNGTYAAVYMIRVGQSGDNINATRIALDAGGTGVGADFTFTASAGHTIVVTSPSNANTRVIIQQMTG